MPAPSTTVTPLRLPALIALLLCLGAALSGCINASTTNPPVTDPTPDSNQDPPPEPAPEPAPEPEPQPSGPTSGLKSIGAGANHNCAITNGDDNLWCWGANSSGQLGDGSSTDSSNFKPIGDETWTLVAVGGDHSCAIKSGGTLWCWGANGSGQLGVGTTSNINVPRRVGSAANANWQTVAVGSDHSCAIKSGGTLWCWGDNSQSQLGDNTLADPTTTPRRIGSDTDWSQVSLGNQAGCAVKQDQSLWCWGDNASGQLGLGDTTDRDTPTEVQPGSAWTNVAVGVSHSCGIQDNDASLWCWGDNTYGQLGQGATSAFSSTPLQVLASTQWSAVVVGDSHSCAIKADGSLWCWGNNVAGQLGVGTTSHLATPTEVSHGNGWRALSAGDYHSCAVDADYIGYCWGLNDTGQLASGNLLGTDTPRRFDDSDDWAAIDSGELHSCGLKQVAGTTPLFTLWCGGGNNYGQLGIGSIANQAAPVQVKGPSGLLEYWASVATGHQYTCAVTAAGALYCWGRNDYGQLGRGSSSANVAGNWSLQTKVSQGLDDWVKVAAGATHTCGIKNNTELWCWGDNSTGQLGNGSTIDSSSSIQVFEDGAAATTPFTALDVAVGGYYLDATTTAGGHTCAIKIDGTLWCWGANDVTQLGDNALANPTTAPQQIGTDTDWAGIGAGNRYTCGIKNTDGLWCWGGNNAGQTGTDSPNVMVETPRVVAAGTTWLDHDLGQQSACAVTSDNRLKCWGDNNQNQLTSQTPTDNDGYAFTPQNASANTDWQAVAMGKTHGCGIREDTVGNRTVYCWGEGAEYQFGDGSAWRTTPQQLSLE